MDNQRLLLYDQSLDNGRHQLTTIQKASAIDGQWLRLEPVRIGSVPSSLGTPHRYFLVEKNDHPFLRIDYYPVVGPHVSEECIIWGGLVAIGIGNLAFLIDIENKETSEYEIEPYFSSFFPLDDCLLVISGQRIHKVSQDGTIVWSTCDLGIDGICIDHVESGWIFGEGDWDPPGGWKQFVLDVSTGGTRDKIS